MTIRQWNGGRSSACSWCCASPPCWPFAVTGTRSMCAADSGSCLLTDGAAQLVRTPCMQLSMPGCPKHSTLHYSVLTFIEIGVWCDRAGMCKVQIVQKLVDDGCRPAWVGVGGRYSCRWQQQLTAVITPEPAAMCACLALLAGRAEGIWQPQAGAGLTAHPAGLPSNRSLSTPGSRKCRRSPVWVGEVRTS